MGEGASNTVHGFHKGNYDEIFRKWRKGKEDVETEQVAAKSDKKPRKPRAKKTDGETPKPKVKKVQKPVVILLTPEMRADKTVQSQIIGHTVIYTDEMPVVPDVILGASAWRILPPLYPYIKLAIKEARTKKYGKVEYKATDGSES
mgnify:CR=1 FL=1